MPELRTRTKKAVIQRVSLTLFFCLFASLAFAQTAISCGQIIKASISAPNEKDVYTFTANANDAITIRTIVTSFLSALQPHLELYAPDNSLIAEGIRQINKTLLTSGTYKIILRDDINFWTGAYSLFWQRFNNPCAINLNCGQVTKGVANGTTVFYSFSAQANDFIGIRTKNNVSLFDKPPGNYTLHIELYAPDGTRIAAADDKIDQKITATGTYVIILNIWSDYIGDYIGQIPYSIAWNRFNDPVGSALNCGQFYHNPTLSILFYTFTAAANDRIYIHSSGPIPVELYSPTGVNLANGKKIEAVVPVQGKYTVIDKGAFSLLWYNFNSSCGIAISPGQTIRVSLNHNDYIKIYTFQAFAGDSISLRFNCVSGSSTSFELFSPDGVSLGVFSGSVNDKIVPQTGRYIIFAGSENLSTSTGESIYDLTFTKQNTPPSVVSLTPSSGGVQIMQPVNFTTVYSDADPAGYLDIQSAYFLMNTSINGANCLYGHYNRNENKLYLRNDANTAWAGGFAPGSNNLIENSYAKLDCSKTTILNSGKTLTINWSVLFKSTLGNKTFNAYLNVKDNMNAESGWVQKGTWRVDAIEITSLLPADKSRYIEGAMINCSAQAIPASTQYQYQFLVNGQIKRAFSTTNTWNWQTASADIGMRTLTVQVKNQYGTQIEKSQKLIIYRKPIEP